MTEHEESFKTNPSSRPAQTGRPKRCCVAALWKVAGAGVLFLGAFFSFTNLAQQRWPASPAKNRHVQQREWFYRQRAYPLGYIPAGVRLRALAQFRQMQKNASSRGRQPRLAKQASPKPLSTLLTSTPWTLIGPEPTNTPFYYPTSAGHVEALAVDPTDSNVVYLGAAEGGVWKTTDGGAHWTPLTDNQLSLAIGSIALDPSNPATVYVGTGDEDFSGGAYWGVGILKSTDGGSTWTQLGASTFAGPFASCNTCGGAFIGALAVSPANSQVILAGASFFGVKTGGVFRSIDGGTNWTNVLSGYGATSVFFDPSNADLAYASLDSVWCDPNNGVYKSGDGGATWARADAGSANPLPTTNIGRIGLALAPSSTTTLYAGIANCSSASFGSLVGMFTSTDGGVNWTQLTNAPGYCNNQCWYDNVISVDPADANHVYAGGIGMFASSDGGSTWTDIDTGSVGAGLHADKHALAFGNNVLYVGNDGGVWSTPVDTVNYTNLNATLAITQFYPGLSIDPTNVGNAFGGTQDNGTQHYAGALAWNYATCGDGGMTAIDFNTPTTVYAECQAIQVIKSTSGGSGWALAENGINTSDPSEFIPPLVMDPSNSQTLYFGTIRVYQTTNGAGLWSVISPDLTGGRAGGISTMAAAPSDSNTVYVGTAGGLVQMTTNAGAGVSATWTNRSAGLPNRYVTQVAVAPANPLIAYVTFSGFSGFGDTQGHVFQTTNGGVNWGDISSNLPNIPVNDIVVDPDNSNTLYVATDVGVLYTTDGGASWAPLGTGLPPVVVFSLNLHRPTRTLRAATYGRSVWDYSLGLAKRRRGQLISQ